MQTVKQQQEQRLKWYKFALNYLETNNNGGWIYVCTILYHMDGDFRRLIIADARSKHLLKELYAKRTNISSGIWFSSVVERKRALEECIEELTVKIEKESVSPYILPAIVFGLVALAYIIGFIIKNI